MVSAFAARQRLVLGQVKVAAKSNEIVAIPKLLDMLANDGAIVTLDAMGCQRAIARKIIDKRADYVLAIKDNQGTLREDVEVFVEEQKANGFQHATISRDQTGLSAFGAKHNSLYVWNIEEAQHLVFLPRKLTEPSGEHQEPWEMLKRPSLPRSLMLYWRAAAVPVCLPPQQPHRYFRTNIRLRRPAHRHRLQQGFWPCGILAWLTIRVTSPMGQAARSMNERGMPLSVTGCKPRHFIGCSKGTPERQIRERHDANHPLLTVQHRQVMDLLLLHHLRNVVEALVLEAPGDTLRHHLARLGRVRIDTVGNRTAGKIPIRNDADQAIVLADRQAADALVAHDAPNLGEREVRGDPLRLERHDIATNMVISWNSPPSGTLLPVPIPVTLGGINL